MVLFGNLSDLGVLLYYLLILNLVLLPSTFYYVYTKFWRIAQEIEIEDSFETLL